MPLVGLQEFFAVDARRGGEPQNLALQPDQPAVEAVKLVQQLLNPVVVEVDVLHPLDQFLAQLLEPLFLARFGLFARGQGLEALHLHPVKLLVGLGDVLEGLDDLGLQLGFKGGEGQVVFTVVLVVIIVVAAALTFAVLARGFGRVVVRRSGLLRVLAVLGGFGGAFLGVFRGGGFGSVAIPVPIIVPAIRVGGNRARLARAAAVGGFQVDDVAQQHVFGDQRVMPHGDGLDGQRAFHQAADHHLAAGFDPFGDGDFAFAGQQLDRPHLAQVHAHRVVRAAQVVLVDVTGGRGGLFLAVAIAVTVTFGRGVVGLFVFDHVDAHFGQHRHGVFDLLRRYLFRGQGAVQVVIGDVPAFLALGDHLLDGRAHGIEKGAVAAFFLGIAAFLIFRLCFCHARPLNPLFGDPAPSGPSALGVRSGTNLNGVPMPCPSLKKRVSSNCPLV